MKDKVNKTITSKPFLAIVLIVITVIALVICFFIQKQPEEQFQPTTVSEAESLEESIEEVEEQQRPVVESSIVEEAQELETQTIETESETVETESAVEIESTTMETKEKEIKEEIPVTEPVEVPKLQEPEVPEGGQPGQVYDPVFGWITPGGSIGTESGSDGDINKPVGNM